MPDEVPPIAVEKRPVEEELQPEKEVRKPEIPEKSPADEDHPTGQTETVTTTKIRFDDFLNLMEVF